MPPEWVQERKEHLQEIDRLKGELIAARLELNARTARFEETLARSEAMRNRQVDIINRLQDGETLPAVLSQLLEENAALKVELDRKDAMLPPPLRGGHYNLGKEGTTGR